MSHIVPLVVDDLLVQLVDTFRKLKETFKFMWVQNLKKYANISLETDLWICIPQAHNKSRCFQTQPLTFKKFPYNFSVPLSFLFLLAFLTSYFEAFRLCRCSIACNFPFNFWISISNLNFSSSSLNNLIIFSGVPPTPSTTPSTSVRYLHMFFSASPSPRPIEVIFFS